MSGMWSRGPASEDRVAGRGDLRPCRDRLDEQGFAGPVPRVECQDPEVPLFSPITKTAERDADRRAARKSRVQPSQRNRRKTGRSAGPARRTAWRLQHPRRPCLREGRRHALVPNQLRHLCGPTSASSTASTARRRRLGHAHAQTTEIYAEVNLDLASKIAEEMG